MPGNPREDITYYQQLIRKLMDGSIEESERQQLEDWYNSGLEDPVHIPAAFVAGEEEQEKRLLEQIRHKAGLPVARRVIAWRGRSWWAAAAAALIIIAGTASLLYYKGSNNEAAPRVIARDVKAPQTNRATITLADGTELVLDSLASGTLALQAHAQLVKLAGGEIAYKDEGGGTVAPVYNTLTNPRGSKVVSIALSDGSRVWLNAGSSITYPVVFNGNKRQVELKGEGYFEVAKKAGQRFVVTARGVQTEVLGTHFNINAYDEEAETRITLLEGAVQVQLPGAARQVLKPGEQASIAAAGKLATLRPDLDQVMAWKQGDFYFSGADIETVMRQAARWYDLDVEYRGSVTGTLSGDISRSVNASELFHMLELTGRVAFEIQGRKVIVIPK
ncbi:FecR family protein [Chitinophaga cymbidii]|uniref:Iron dicitrate transporter FecR n=1 Tax=Chitinophaga cymbidii TaxID=1096750 RepID=A0A512RQU3_9BACT|nr:FecR family protein [Chitinophaga cymbidii]GEP98055.1 iron dicitrate transporter FecR [Chitinophaga cymbidii]